MKWDSLQPREKRMVVAWPIAAAVFALIYFWPSSTTPEAAQRFTDIPTAELRVARMRQIAASIPTRQKVIDDAKKELAIREQGVMRSPTAAQEQANLSQTLRKLARAQGIDIQQSEIAPIQALGKAYGEAPVTLSFTCRIEQLLNLIADISSQKELMSTRDLQVRQADEKRKTVFVRMTVSTVTPPEMAPKQGKA